MLIRLLALALVFGSCVIGFSQETFPTRMIGFLKAGQHVGISNRTEPGSTLIIFQDQTDKEIHKDAEKMSVDELRRKYDKIEQQANEIVKSHAKGSNSTGSLEIGRVAPVRYAKVLHVGDDYALLEYENGYRTAYSSTRIGSFVWDDGKPNLYIATANETAQTDRTKR